MNKSLYGSTRRGRIQGGLAALAKHLAALDPAEGTALGIFGAGNVGAAVTKFLAPVIMVAFGWKMVAIVWAAALLVMAVAFAVIG